MDSSHDEMLYDPPAIADRVPIHDMFHALLELAVELDRRSTRKSQNSQLFRKNGQ